MSGVAILKTVLVLVFLLSTHEVVRIFSRDEHGTDDRNRNSVEKSNWKTRKILQQSNESNQFECSEVLNVNHSYQCNFVKTTKDCQVSDGFIQYLYLPYCLLPHGLAFFILFLWLGFLFIVLGTTADDYFCPSLVVISRTLKLSQNVAGVTFLAFGNGAPDIFSTIAAFSHAQREDSASELGIEALLGAGIFVTTMVMGTISLISRNFTVTRRPFIRDIVFYMSSVVWMAIALYRKELTLIQSVGFIILYVFYAGVVIIGRYIFQYWKRKKRRGNVSFSTESAESIDSSHGKPYESIQEESSNIPADEKAPLLDVVVKPITSQRAVAFKGKPLRKLCHDLLPFTTADWQQSGLLAKSFMLLKSPVAFALNLTTPIVDYSEPDQRWNKWLHVIHCITGPVFIVMATKIGTVLVAGQIPVWLLALCIGVIFGLIVAIATKSDHPPKFQFILAFMGFPVSVVWIYLTANEIVYLLQTFGIAFKLSNAILGLTFLAWGNSIGDLVSNGAMARKGFPNMGASACFGGPMLNLLMGIGISCTILSVKQGHSVKLPHKDHQYIISAGFLATSLASSGIVIPLMGFKVPRLYGAYLILLYACYLTVSIYAEIKRI